MVSSASLARGLAEFFAELKRRQMFRVAAAYAVVAWLLLQIVNNVAPVLDLPVWVARAFLLLLMIGFPIALLFVWMRELAPADALAPKAGASKIDYTLIGGLVLVIALVSYQQLAPPGATTAQGKGDVEGAAQANAATGIAIAVLPLANLSGDATQEFFSDGMTDEITSALAKVRDLRVVGRSSAFQFKGQNRDLRAIGQALAARFLIDGSVRREGDRVRITAQLIQADNGLNVWTESYDRQLTGVFAIQEEIAQAIAGALRVPLGLQQGERLVSNRTDDTASYQDYLRAKALVRARGLQALTDAAALLEQVVARDPNYAPAWAQLSLAYNLIPNYHPAWFSGSVAETRRVVDASLPKAQAAAQRALQLDPENADGYTSLAYEQAQRGKLLAAESSFMQALEFDPGNPDALHLYSLALAAVGRLSDSLVIRRQLQTMEPFVPVYKFNTAHVLWEYGETDAAIALAQELRTDFVFGGWLLAAIYSSLGRHDDAAEALLTIGSGIPRGTIEDAARVLRTAPRVASSPESLPDLGVFVFAYLYVGAPDRVLEFYQGNSEAGYLVPATLAMLWHPSYAPARKTERFKTLARTAGLVDYWRAKGWPNVCRPVGADDFVCD
jgi:TolB-like protein